MVQKQKKEIEKKKEGHGQMRRRRRRRSVGEIRKPQEMAEAVSSVRQLARRRERERERRLVTRGPKGHQPDCTTNALQCNALCTAIHFALCAEKCHQSVGASLHAVHFALLSSHCTALY